MSRTFFVLFAALMVQIVTMSTASAQQGHDACARDVARLCRAVMGDGDSAVLGCLKQHRGRVSRACDKVMSEHGQ